MPNKRCQKQFQVLPKTKWSANQLWELKLRSLLPLCLSLVLFGIGEGFLLLSNFGSAPWTILSQGVALQANISVGFASFLISCLVMLSWIPLRLKIGLGTVLNIVLIAVALDISTALLTPPDVFVLRLFYAVFGIVLMGIGSAFYLTCHMGAGPRDGLMVGLCHRFKLHVGVVRTAMESSVAIIGFLLGGTLGLATLLFAFSIGWVIQATLYLLRRYSLKNKF